MALINLSLNLDTIDKSKVIHGKKGKYLSLTIATYNKTDDFGNNVSAYHSQTKEEREGMTARQYLGNGRVVAGGEVVKAEPQEGSSQQSTKVKVADDVEWDFI